MKFRILILSFVLGAAVATCVAEDVIWSSRPDSNFGRIPDGVVTGNGPVPGGVIRADYVVSNIIFDTNRCDDSQPGIVNQITTWFDDDGMQFGKTTGIARLNVFIVPAQGDLPSTNDNPDLGMDVPVTYEQIVLNGMNVVQVQANNLGQLPERIFIQEGIRYFIGLTPIFNKGEELFSGQHLANFEPNEKEDPSAVRRTFPQPDTDWSFAFDPALKSPLYATIEIRGFTTPTIYLSSKGFGEGAQPGREILDLPTGTSETVYIWVDKSLAVDTTLSLNMNLVAPGVAKLDLPEAFFPPIVDSGGAIVGRRWDFVDSGMISPNGQLLFNMIGRAIDAGTGIIPDNAGSPFFDDLYDPSADAFLFGSLEVSALGPGVTELNLSPGPMGIVNSFLPALPVFGNMTICNVIRGDINGDGVVNLLDVAPFIQLLSSGIYRPEGDTNKDGKVNLLDIGPFIELLGGG